MHAYPPISPTNAWREGLRSIRPDILSNLWSCPIALTSDGCYCVLDFENVVLGFTGNMDSKKRMQEDLCSKYNCNICNFCLSIERRTTSISQLPQSVRNLDLLCGQSLTTRLCWECCARLYGYLKFREQVKTAQQILVNEFLHEGYYETKCLSKLAIHVIGITLDCSDKVSVNTLEQIKEEIGSPPDCEAWIDPTTDEYDEHEDIKIISQEQESYIHEPIIEVEFENIKTNKEQSAEYQNHDQTLFEMFTATESEMKRYLKLAGKYKCKMCLLNFTGKVPHLRHMNKYHSDSKGEFRCDICKLLHATETSLQSHRRQHHVMYRCRMEGCSFVHKFGPSLRAHKKLHDASTKEKTKNTDKSGSLKTVKIKSKIKYEFEQYICDHCHKMFPSRRQITLHMMRLHLPRKVVCELCAFTCLNQSQLKYHMLAHLDPSHRKYECKICHKKFRDKYKERLHQFVHNGKRRNRCKICKTEFASEELLNKHNETRHGSTENRLFKTSIQPRTKSKFVYGRKNDKRDDSDDSYHQYGAYNSDTNTFKCHMCAKEVSDTTALKLHANWHKRDRKEHKCDVCDKIFNYKYLLEAHINKIHLKERPFKCHICNAGSWTKHNLATHMKTHTNERPFKCDMCNASFKYGSGLWTHKTMHKGEKPFMCNICGASFALNGNLKGHMKIHTGERPFECGVCGKRFPYKRNLRNHLKVHDKESLANFQ